MYHLFLHSPKLLLQYCIVRFTWWWWWIDFDIFRRKSMFLM